MPFVFTKCDVIHNPWYMDPRSGPGMTVETRVLSTLDIIESAMHQYPNAFQGSPPSGQYYFQ